MGLCTLSASFTYFAQTTWTCVPLGRRIWPPRRAQKSPSPPAHVTVEGKLPRALPQPGATNTHAPRGAIWNHPRWWRRRRMRGKGQKPTNSSRHGFKLLISESFWSREDRPYPAIFTPRYGDARFPPRGHGATALMPGIVDALASWQRTSSEVPDQCQLPQGRGLCRGALLHDIGGVAGTSHRRA